MEKAIEDKMNQLLYMLDLVRVDHEVHQLESDAGAAGVPVGPPHVAEQLEQAPLGHVDEVAEQAVARPWGGAPREVCDDR